MSEQAAEQNPQQADQGQGQSDAAAPSADQPTPQAQTQTDTSATESFPLSLVKRPTGDVHWNTAKGIWETITHAETGEPTQEYALVTTIDGQEVTLETFNAGRLETVARSLSQASG